MFLTPAVISSIAIARSKKEKTGRAKNWIPKAGLLENDAEAQSTNELARYMENRDDWKQRWRTTYREM